MASKKLETEHLARQIEAILDEDGISPERLAILSGTAKSTIYSILNRERPTTQRDVARKIAKATAREFHIEEDKIFFSKPENVISQQSFSAIENEILTQFGKLLKNYSEEEKLSILKYGVENLFREMLDFILAIRVRAMEEVTGVIPPFLAAKLRKHDSGKIESGRGQDIAAIDKKFCEIWDRAAIDKEDKIKATYELLKGTNLPKLIYTSFRLEIDIFNPEGDATLTWDYHATNVGENDILGELKSIWFENNQKEDIQLQGTLNQTSPLSIEMIRNYENYKEFFCNFLQPVKFGESIQYTYKYSPRQMFTANHYWDWQVRNLTLNAKIVIKHQKNKKFKSCGIKRETGRGLVPEDDANPNVKSDDKAVEISWMKYFPAFGTKYRIYWDFYE